MRDLRSLPTPAFIVGFGALLVICVVLTIGLFNYESGAEERAASATAKTGTSGSSTTTTESTTTPVTTVTGPGEEDKVAVTREPKPAPPGTDEKQVKSSIRSYLIQDAATARTYTGVAVTGTVSEEALGMMPELTGHISRLLEQNCLDAMALETPDNTRVTFNGFCYTSLPPETIERMLTFALDGKADSIDFANHPNRGHKNAVTMNWFVDSNDVAEKIHETWNPLRRPRAIEKINLYTYSPNEVHRVVKSRGKPDYATTEELTGESHQR